MSPLLKKKTSTNVSQRPMRYGARADQWHLRRERPDARTHRSGIGFGKTVDNVLGKHNGSIVNEHNDYTEARFDKHKKSGSGIS